MKRVFRAVLLKRLFDLWVEAHSKALNRHFLSCFTDNKL